MGRKELISQDQSSVCFPEIRFPNPKKKRLLQRKEAERDQEVMNQIKAEVQDEQAAEEALRQPSRARRGPSLQLVEERAG